MTLDLSKITFDEFVRVLLDSVPLANRPAPCRWEQLLALGNPAATIIADQHYTHAHNMSADLRALAGAKSSESSGL